VKVKACEPAPSDFGFLARLLVGRNQFDFRLLENGMTIAPSWIICLCPIDQRSGKGSENDDKTTSASMPKPTNTGRCSQPV
jgi:hypothetical protein